MGIHALRRTSPKGPGQPFVGVCLKCGREDIPIERATEDCPNIRGLNDHEALIEALDGGDA